MKKPFLLILIFCLLGCDDDTDETRLIINHFQQPTTLLSDYFIYVIQDGTQIGTDEWEYHSPEILGFDYEWGYVYDLKVKLENIGNPPQDGSSIRTSLVKMISKKKVSTDEQFEIRLSRAYDDGEFRSYAHHDGASGFMLLNKVAIDCGDGCTDLLERLTNKESLIGVFRHIDTGIKLVTLKEE